jgi:uridine kinase
MNRIESILKKSAYDPDKTPNPEQVLFTIQNENIGSLQNFITITGPPKAGKSRFLSAIISSGLTQKELFTMNLRLTRDNYKILHIDTEQSEYDYYKMLQQVKNMARITRFPEHFESWNMREYDAITIIQCLEWLVEKTNHLGVIIIDGILDLLNSYNDETESKLLINCLKRWTKMGNCLIICILHTGKTTGTTVGHFGAMADRASQSVIEVKRNEIDRMVTYSLVPKITRSADPNNINPVEIYWDTQTTSWERTGFIPLPARDKGRMRPDDVHPDQHAASLKFIFNTLGMTAKYNDLVREVGHIYGQPAKWAKGCVSYYLQNNLVFKNEKGLFQLHQQAKLPI